MTTKPFAIAGVKPISKPVEEKKKESLFPRTLSNGSILIAELGSGHHVMSLIQQTDPAQKYKYLVDCKCGVQGRSHLEEDSRKYAEHHLRHNRVSI